MNKTCLAGLLLLGLSTAAGAEAERPHIVFLLADDLGWADVGYHGAKQIETPAIDRLARGGVRLEQFYVQPVCSPTRAALMTGRYPMRYGLQCGVVRPWAEHGLPLDEVLLPELLSKAGYKTAICGKWHLGHLAPEYLPSRRGFDLQFGHYNGALDYFTHIRDGGLDWHRNARPLRQEGYATDLIGREAVEILEQHDQSQPLFLYVPFNAPHTPLQAPPEAIERYRGIRDKQRRIFAAMVWRMDKAIGDILWTLGEQGYENTLVIFCSDNGGIPRLGSNGPLRAGKGTLYEGGVRVVAAANWKGKLAEGGVIDEPMHIVDTLPTLAGWAGAELPQAALDGVDQRATLLGEKPSPRTEILHNVTPFHGALRSGDWKLVHNGQVSANATSAPETEKWELFNLAADPGEQTDLSARQPERLEQLRQRLAEYAEQAAKANIPPNRPPAGFQVPKVWGVWDQ